MIKNMKDDLLKKEKYESIVLCFLFVASVLIRYSISNFSKTVTISDELIYFDLAKSIAGGTIFQVENVPFGFQQIMYSVIISPVFNLVNDNILQIKMISLINCLLMSSVIFPASLLAKKIIEDKKIRILIYLIVLTLPDLVYSIGFMSENLYYPVAIWFVYFAISSLENEGKRKNRIFEFLLGIFAGILYYTKIVGLAFIVAYILSMFLLVIMKHKSILNSILDGVFCILGFAGVYIVMNMTILHGMSSTYGSPVQLCNSLYEWLYFAYALLYNIIIVIVAFVYFPVVCPGIQFTKLKKIEKILYTYISITLGIMLIVIVSKISIKEDIGSFSPRQHLRYVAPIFITYLVIFINNIGKIKIIGKYKTFFCYLTTIFVCMVLFLFNGRTYTSPVNGTLLNYIMLYFGNDAFSLSLPNTEMVINMGMLLFKLFFVIGIGIGIFMIFKRNRKMLIITFSVLIFLINFINNYCTIFAYNKLYPVEEETITQINKINEHMRKMNGNVMYIGETSKNFDQLLYWETYNSVDGVIVSKEALFEQINLGEERKIAELTLTSAIFGKEYVNCENIEYIVFNKTLDNIIVNGAEEIYIDGVDDYIIYKNIDSENIKFGVAEMPTIVGGMSEFSNELMCGQAEQNGNIISVDNQESILVYGPYCKIEPGIYNIEYQYDYSCDSKEKMEIGYVDIYMPDTNNQYYSSKMYSENNNVCLENVVIIEESNVCELRMFTYVAGVKFNKIIVQKIK